jgi:rod shape determining protein RodA
MNTSPSWRNFDPLLLVATLALTGYGALLIYSATLPRGAEGIAMSEPVIRHIGAAIAGTLAMFIAARVDYRLYETFGWLAYGFGLILLITVLFFGSSEFGSRRWFDLGFTVVQASEVAKLLVIIGLSRFLSDNRNQITEWRIFTFSLALAVLPAGLVVLEPDIGSAIVFLVIWAVMVAFAGAKLRHFVFLAIVALALVPIALAGGIKDYQQDRIRIFIDPMRDAQGAGFNVLQAETSVGSGGLLGKGITQGTQTQLDFLRTQSTDFIFSVLGEELGFIGAMALFGLFLLLILRGLRAINRATDSFSQVLIAGVITMISIQAFINIGVNIRLVPVTGIPLPFISVGNSSLLILFIALGLIQSILMHRDDSLRQHSS